MHIRPFKDSDEAAVVALWQACGLTRNWNDPHKDVQRKLNDSPEWFLVGELDGRIVASVMVGYDGHRGWINYLGILPEHQRKGLGLELMREAERVLREAGCPKINLQVRAENKEAIQFYESIGFKQDPVLSMGKRLEEDGIAPA